MEHLEWHNHAFIDKDNTVIGVAVFRELDHDTELLDAVQQSYGADKTVCCCTFGMAYVGYTWTGTEFQSPKPYPSWTWDSATKLWIPPTPQPTDGNGYTWDESLKNWVEIPSSS